MDYECRLTTVDNPYNPFDEFDLWLMFDIEKGYQSSERLARIAKYTDDMTELEFDLETERAIDEIIKYDFLNIFKKVTKKLNSTEDKS